MLFTTLVSRHTLYLIFVETQNLTAEKPDRHGGNPTGPSTVYRPLSDKTGIALVFHAPASGLLKGHEA
jgi:hypothetical protein